MSFILFLLCPSTKGVGDAGIRPSARLFVCSSVRLSRAGRAKTVHFRPKYRDIYLFRCILGLNTGIFIYLFILTSEKLHS